MIDSPALTKLLLSGLSGKITWLTLSESYSVDEYIEAFRRTRALMTRTVADLTDEQAAFQVDGNPTWSISEMVTHLIYSQAFYYNQLLEITTSQLPHILEAAKGLGEGAKLGIPAAQLRVNLQTATAQINDAIERTRINNDPTRITLNPIFGRCNYRTWILLLLGHETDHVHQGILMRRAAKSALRSENSSRPAAEAKPATAAKKAPKVTRTPRKRTSAKSKRKAKAD